MSNIVVMNRKYGDSNALDNVIDYCYGKCADWYGYGVRIGDIEDAKDSMKYIKKYYNQLDGRQLVHFVINVDSFKNTGIEYSRMTMAKDEAFLTDFVHIISVGLFNAGYQNCMFLHRDRKTPHAHFVINSVNCRNGKKLRDPMLVANQIFDYLKKTYPALKWERVYYNKVYSDELGYQRKDW